MNIPRSDVVVIDAGISRLKCAALQTKSGLNVQL